MIEVFKTNVPDTRWAKKLVELLCQNFPACCINFDLNDCDKILRVEGEHFIAESVRMIMNENGFTCEILD